VLRAEDLPADRRATNQRQLGGQWIDWCDSAVLEVRSTIVPLEHNYLLNPRHPDFREIAVEPPVAFVFDERLFVSR
jgi:RES domain-containing protein